MSYTKLNLENSNETREYINRVFCEQNILIQKITEKIAIHQAEPRKSRPLLAVDSGMNSAYETPFVMLKAAVVNEKIEVTKTTHFYLFNVEDNFQTDRLKRLKMQEILYETLTKTIQNGKANNSLVLVDGTITLNLFYPSERDSKEYKTEFSKFLDEQYAPLIKTCLEKNILLLGFLKRTGSKYIGEFLNIPKVYDVYAMQMLLTKEGQYIEPIPIGNYPFKKWKVPTKYLTFYVNLKTWNYRFELIHLQKHHYLECIKNLLYWSTQSHYGMNPIFSKADEYARVKKREVNHMFNFFFSTLSPKDQNRLHFFTRKRTHFGLQTEPINSRLRTTRRDYK